ncbi:hypothetical protein BCE75_102204 [Isoptericola sp. CG 20/1183]|uniref:Uncharacterized protein n=1 Tax=Isoptericola halotolerans TaxID=300560 RepID=A0ABX5EII5_9MICO|nr:hypothetical protein BCE75_102204 [Isoptericola sp. CG 20/1183]PRZ10292.1 hypothetical protein BCL65_101436 [Isoptericola halotolerans]
MRRITANDEALPPADGSSVAPGQTGFPFGPVPTGGDDGAAAGDAPADPGNPPPAAPWATPPASPAPPWASAVVPTAAPALDDVLDGTADVAGTFRDTDRKPRKTKGARDKSKRSSRRTSRTSRTSRETDSGAGDDAPLPAQLGGAPGGAAPDAPPSRPSRTSRSSRRPATRRGGEPPAGSAVVQDLTARARSAATALPRRKATGFFARRATLFVAGAAALLAGVGAGAAVDLVRGGAETSTDVATAAVVSPEVCAAAQVAWSRAASAQVRMDAESPRSLRTGFVGARDYLSKVDPPAAVITDWATVLTYVTAAADAAQEAEDGEVGEAVAGALQEHDTAAMTAASQRITDYLGADCAPDAP